MELKPGDYVWVPCEVKPGPFSNERFVRVQSGGEDWVGFVNTMHLKDSSISTGRTEISARVNAVEGGNFTARLPGHAVGNSTQFRGGLSEVASPA